MSYLTQAQLARDPHNIDRVTACAAGAGVDDPQKWAFAHAWALSALPTWNAAYAEAIGEGCESPGANENVITDAMIFDAVRTLTDTSPAK